MAEPELLNAVKTMRWMMWWVRDYLPACPYCERVSNHGDLHTSDCNIGKVIGNWDWRREDALSVDRDVQGIAD